MHLPNIIQDLAVILIVAGVMTLLFRVIRQPAVLGYIVAGFLVGPSFEWLPTVVDQEGIRVWAEIGVLFLLFALGLEFSFRKLANVGSSASVIACIEVAGMTGLGYLTGKLFGWSGMDSLFLGGILAISSTTIIIRTFEELQMKSLSFVRLVFGVLIVEDLVAILLMVLLSTIAVTQTVSGIFLLVASLKLFFFLTLWFLLGIFLLPSFLKRARQFLEAESLLVVSLGLCFLMVVLATKAGFSPALGAFIMGSILAETIHAKSIEKLIHPIKDLFGAIFFVSVGMLIDPVVLYDYAFPIFIITLVTIFGKSIITFLGALFAGQNLRHSVQAGMSLAQIGEFSFVIAGLGLSLNVTSEFLYPIAISVSAITAFTTPYLIRSSHLVLRYLESTTLFKGFDRFEKFRLLSSTTNSKDSNSMLTVLLPKLLINSVVVVAIFLFVTEFFEPWLLQRMGDVYWVELGATFVAFLVSAPFLWAIIDGKLAGQNVYELWKDKQLKGSVFVFEILRIVYGILLFVILAAQILSPGFVLITVVACVLVSVFFFSNRFRHVYNHLEALFVANLNDRDAFDPSSQPQLAPWDANLIEVRVSPNSSFIGKTLSELMLRETYGITIALISRGNNVVSGPDRYTVLYPGDLVQVIGSDDQLRLFKQACEATEVVDNPQEFLSDLRSFYIGKGSIYLNKTIRESGLREKSLGLVVGIEKKGVRYLNPDSSVRIECGDIVWVVGEQKHLSSLNDCL